MHPLRSTRRPASTFGLQLPLPDWAPSEAAQALVLDPDSPRPAGQVVYPASFDVLDDAASAGDD